MSKKYIFNIKEYKIIINDDLLPQLQDVCTRKFESEDDYVDLLNIPFMLQEFFNMSRLAEEYMYVVSLDESMNVKGVFELAHGCNDKVEAHARELHMFLLLTGGEGFVLAHNHPNGNLEISDQDRTFTEYIKSCSDLMDTNFLEHFIITRNGYTGILNEENRIDYPLD